MLKTKLVLVLSLFTLFAMAQEYEFDSDEFPGEIILKKGGTRKGYIDMKGSDMSPWNNQNSLKFFSEDALADGKVKGKEKEKFKPKDLKGYIADGRYFETIKISAAKLTMGMGINETKFVERFVDGKIKMYKLYDSPDPTGVYVGEEAIAAHEQELENMRNNPMLVLQKDDGKYTLLRKINLKEYLAECPEVVDKYMSGDYGIEPFNTDAETKLGKMIANSFNAENVEAIITEILTDYNNCVK